MTYQCFAKWGRRALIKQNLHSSSFERAPSDMLKNRASLLGCHTGKPLDEVMQRRVIFQVLEEGRDRYARTAEDPCSAYACGVTFNSRAGRPVDHGGIVAPGRDCAA